MQPLPVDSALTHTSSKIYTIINSLKQTFMKTRIFLTMLLAIASVGAKADEAQCILPWGADEPWQMKYVLDTNQPNDDWTTANYDDSEWETLTGPLSNLLGSAVDGVATTGVYNTAGQRINKMQRGVNIADGKEVLF